MDNQHNLNYFQLYQIPEAFIIDKAILKQKYFELSRKFHPDFFGDATDAEKEEVLEKSSTINKAYKCFSNGDETMKYVLMMNGILNEDEKFALPKDFLIEMMDFNEAIMDAKMDNDIAKLNSLEVDIKKIETTIYAPIKEYIETYNENSYSQEGLLQVKEYYFKKKYINRIAEGLK